MKLLTLKRLAFYIVAFLVIMNLFFWTGSWKPIDNLVFSKLSFDTEQASKVRSSIAVIDVNLRYQTDPDQEISIGSQRAILLDMLKSIDAQQAKPEVLILDFSFANDTTLVPELREVLESLSGSGVKLYSAYDVDAYDEAPADMQDYFIFDLQQSQVLYDSVFKKRLHTVYTVRKDGDRFNIGHETVRYLNNLDIDGNIDSVAIESLAKRVALDQTDPESQVDYEVLTVPLGSADAMYEETYVYIPGEGDGPGRFEASRQAGKTLEFAKKDFIIVGDLTNDIIDTEDQADAFPGPHLVAWNLNEDLATDEQKIVRQYESSLIINIIQTLVFALLTIGIFALLFKYLKRFQTKPLILTILAILISCFLLLPYMLLFLSQDKVPALGLTLFAIVVAALLAWRFAYKFLVTGIAEGSQKYDVFISYSHGNSDWVKKNVLEPLRAYERPGGGKLEIFFDEKSIGIGEPFTSKYMWGIVDSKVFIPVMSEEYYGKNHCKNEMDLAYKRFVEELIHLIPVVFSFDAVPPIYTHINFKDVSKDPNFMEAVCSQIEEYIQDKS